MGNEPAPVNDGNAIQREKVVDMLDPDEQELQEIQEHCTQAFLASDQEYRQQVNAAYLLLIDHLQGATEEQKRLLWQQYAQQKAELLRQHIERDRAIIETYAQRKQALEDRLRHAPTEPAFPLWRCRITHLAAGAPSHLKQVFAVELDGTGRAGLLECLGFFMNRAQETAQGSPLELEVVRVTHEDSVIFLKGREVTDRAVYHVDFRLPGQRDLIGHAHLHPEVIGAWVTLGGRFIQRVMDYDERGRPLRFQDRIHHPIPKRYTE